MKRSQIQQPAMACCWTEDGESVCCLQHGHSGEHVFTGRCNHTDQPTGYKEWHSWALKKSKTHRQYKCPHCGLWAIWMEKTKKSVKAAVSTSPTTKGTAKGALRTENMKRELRNVRYF